MINKNELLKLVNNQLAIDMNCSVDDFSKNNNIYTKFEENTNQRKCIRNKPYVELITMGKACIITIDDEIKHIIENEFENKSRNEICENSILTESEIHYIPDLTRITTKKELPKEFKYEIKEKEEITKLYNLPEFEGFDNAIQYGKNYVGDDVIVLYAQDNEKIIAMAGASCDTDEMWQIGVDVKEEYRNKGLATSLVSNLANIILEKGKIPYYSTTSSNIPSQLVAYKCGFMPYWYSKKIINNKYLINE